MDLTPFISGALGGLVVAASSHFFILDREARARKIDFRGFLGGWLSNVRRVRAGDEPATYNAYSSKVQHLEGYAAKLSKDFYRKRRFKELCDSLALLEPHHINNDAGDCREVVARKIEALIEFV
jgi:hypothetical protein